MVRKKFSKKEIFFGLIGILFALFTLCFYIWHQTESVSLGYDTAELEYTVLCLEKEVEKLETVKSSLLSLERVEKRAKEKLGLKEPKKVQIIYKDYDPKH